jgi:RNA polymerase sigma-70 factor (ECF subfamily)
LLAEVAVGNERAFKVLFDGYYNALGEYIYQLTESRDLAQEIVQDCFLKVWVKRSELSGIQNFSNYLFILCRNQAYNALRKKANERNVLQVFGQMMEGDLSGEGEQSAAEYRRLLDAAIDKLPPQAQKVYLLSRDKRLKYEEIARLLDISSETVKKHIQYANKFIRDDLRGHMNLAVLTVLLTPLLS